MLRTWKLNVRELKQNPIEQAICKIKGWAVENSLWGWLLQTQKSPEESPFEAAAIFLSSEDANLEPYTEFHLWQPQWSLQTARLGPQGSYNKQLQITDIVDSQLPKSTLAAFRKLRVEAFLPPLIKIFTEQRKFLYLYWWVSHKKQQVVTHVHHPHDTSLYSWLTLRVSEWPSRTVTTTHKEPFIALPTLLDTSF